MMRYKRQGVTPQPDVAQVPRGQEMPEVRSRRESWRKDVDAIQRLTMYEGYVRALWWERLDPSRDPRRFGIRLYRSWDRCFASEARRILGSSAPRGFDLYYGVPLIRYEDEGWTPEWFERVHSYESFGSLLNDFRVDSDDPRHDLIERGKKQFRDQTAALSPEMIGSVRSISLEYMLWLRKHPDVVARVSWKAFEQIVAEVFASKGFVVELTGRARNDSCDIFAVRTDELGVETKYLIECKRYASTRVGMSIVNQVIGAAKRHNVDHALLVTTGRFSRDVRTQEAGFRDLRLHLRDGAELEDWLREYKPHGDAGLWLMDDWKEPFELPSVDADADFGCFRPTKA